MAAGLIIKDASGNVTLDTTKSVVMYLGYHEAATANSATVSVPEFANGTPWVQVCVITPFIRQVNVTTTSSGFSWSYSSNVPPSLHNRVFFRYGIY